MKTSEFEIQALLLIRLRDLGLQISGEIKAGFGRIDLVIFDSSKIAIRAIEVKRYRPKGLAVIEAVERQISRYQKALGITVDCVCGTEEAARYIRDIEAHLGSGKSIAEFRWSGVSFMEDARTRASARQSSTSKYTWPEKLDGEYQFFK